MMNEEVLLLILKLLRKVRNAIPILRVCENLISLVTFIATEIYKKTKILDVVNVYTKNETVHQGANDNLILEMQMSDRKTFFNYFRMTSELFKELLVLLLDYVYINKNMSY